MQLSGPHQRWKPLPYTRVPARSESRPLQPMFGQSDMDDYRSPKLNAVVTQCLEAFKSANSILISTHKAPDDDAIGSVIAMQEFLRQLYPGKRIDAAIPEGINKSFHRIWDKGDPPDVWGSPLSAHPMPNRYDLAITLDCAGLSRLPGEVAEYFDRAHTRINIDHHENEQFADINVVDKNAPSTTALLYREFIYPQEKIRLNKRLWDSVLAGIMGDTQDLTLSDNSEALDIIADLEKHGGPSIKEFLSRKDQHPMEVIKLSANAVAQYSGQVGDIAYVLMPQSLIRTFNGVKGQLADVTDAFFKAMYAVKEAEGVQFYFGLLEQPDGKTLLSLRSKSPSEVSAAEVARIFRGGGTPTQAAAELNVKDRDLHEIPPQVIHAIQQVKKLSQVTEETKSGWFHKKYGQLKTFMSRILCRKPDAA